MQEYVKKPWGLDDTKELAILYYMVANSQEIARILNRTKLSINKRLTRSGIKMSYCQLYSIKPSRYFPEKCDNTTIKDALLCFKQKHSQINGMKTYDLTQYLYSQFPPIKKLKSRQSHFDKQKNSCKHLGLWLSGAGLKSFLKRHGITVKESQRHNYAEDSHKYTINGQHANTITLLKTANQIAQVKKLPKVYLEGVTDYTECTI